MQGMQPKKPGHKPASPECAGHPSQNQKDHECVGDMQQETGQMVPLLTSGQNRPAESE